VCDRFGFSHHDLSSVGKSCAPRGAAIEQLDAQLRFECINRVADRGCCALEAPRGARKAPGFGDGQKDLQLIKTEGFWLWHI
jgi:hypothetical protein